MHSGLYILSAIPHWVKFRHDKAESSAQYLSHYVDLLLSIEFLHFSSMEFLSIVNSMHLYLQIHRFIDKLDI